ncbi:hypothetical protein [Flavobacterium sp.]|uniref:hypothetical protein n=1 Tax=Flavobacterium sp. TaxID=239 RepID=UPI00261DD607|nr:hypothetical protein [Flavobacterium sp.]
MENQDTIFNQFKEAAQKAESKDFPGMDKVWSRVDEKLNTKVLVKKSNLWKKIAVAASVALVISIAYQYLKSDTIIISPTEIQQTPTIVQEQVEEPITTSNPSESIKEDAEKILKKQITTENAVVMSLAAKQDKTEPIVEVKANDSEKKEDNNANYILRGKVFDAIGVHHTTADTVKVNTNGIAKKTPPLVVVDGKAITEGKKSGEKTLQEMDRDELESVVYLKEPLYIINGIHYSEEDLFGAKPTSPYAPLDQQEIKTITILQDEEAVEKYGEKGKKGVVIITTKTGKPASPK